MRGSAFANSDNTALNHLRPNVINLITETTNNHNYINRWCLNLTADILSDVNINLRMTPWITGLPQTMPKVIISTQEETIISTKRLEFLAKLHKLSLEEALTRCLLSKLHPTRPNKK